MIGDGSRAALRSIGTLFGAGTVSGLDDGQLLERFATLEGEAAGLAFGALVERHGPMVLRVCRGVLRDEHDAEDAFQATFLILARRARSIRSRNSLAPWLHGVAHNVAATARSAAARRLRHEIRAGESRPLWVAGSTAEDLGPVVHEEIARLPERHRSAVVLCCLEGLTQQEAAQQLGWPLGTLQSRLARGRGRLRDRLARRGLAPSATLPLATSGVEAPPSAVPDGLASGAARAWATGAVSVAVEALAKRAVRTMMLNQGKVAGLTVLLATGIVAAGAAVRAYQDPKPDPAAPARAASGPVPPVVASSGDGRLPVAGQVLMPDGSPAAGAVVESTGDEGHSSVSVRTDDAGRFVLRGVFGNGSHLRASSADGKLQARLGVASVATRATFAAPLALTLSPATVHEVTVLASGRPVEGAHVAALGADFRVRGVTGRDGRVDLLYPAGEKLQGLVAWDPALGVDGRRDLERGLPGGPTRLSLLPPGPHRIRVVDPDEKPVAGLELGLNFFKAEASDWIVTQEVEAARVRTDADGWATVPWAPAEGLKFIEVVPVNTDWKFDETDRKLLAKGITTVHARLEKAVEGRLVMPDGADAEGILITGFGFGPKNNGDIPYARAGRDGRFTLRVPAEHAYVLGISDLQWAADPWSGMILGRETWTPAEIVMNVYPATPMTARVTRGQGREPVANSSVEVSSRAKVDWTDAKGEKRSGSAGARYWLRTDAQGMARAGVGRGEQRIRVSSGLWDEERMIKVDSTKPVEIEFHRPWLGDRRVTGRLTVDGAPYEPSPTLVARAWTPRTQMMPLEFPPEVHPDGTFGVAFDAETLSLYFFDRQKQKGGYARLVQETAVEVALESTASYAGTLLDENDRPMADRSLQVFVKTSSFEAVAAQQTDQAGRFRFPVVPANVPLELNLRHEGDDPDYYLFDRDRMFKRGEIREGDRLRASRAGSAASAARPTVPLAESVENLCRNARASGMRVLIVLQGDASEGVIMTADRLRNDERSRAMLSYLPLHVEAARLAPEAATLADLGWPRPAPGEVVLVAMDGDRTAVGVERVATRDVAASAGVVDDFVSRHRPPTRDAHASLVRAREEAKGSGRRVWVVHGGPRCGPCFRMARWMEEHHAALEKDYVLVKVMDGVDDHVVEAIAGLPEQEGEGIPWHAITEPDGTILTTSVGPLGNIGFPGSVEGVRHLRQMIERTARRLRPDELDGLVKSLSPDR